MLVLADGSVIVGGGVNVGPTSDFTMARYRPDGGLDPAFAPGGDDGDGVVTVAFPGFGHRIALAPDGKILLSGHDLTASYLARFGPDGTPDASFGTAGLVTTRLASGQLDPEQFAVAPDGRIVVAGAVDPTPGDMVNRGNFVVLRYTPDGTLDPTFGTGGVATARFVSDWQEASALQLLPDGKILAGGFATRDGEPGIDFALAHFNPDGTLDPAFGPGGAEGDGKVMTAFANHSGRVIDLAMLPDGRFVAVGAWTGDLLIARYNPNGSLDPTFGPGGADGDGRVATNFYTDAYGNSSSESPAGVVVLPDGKLLVGGSAIVPPEPPGNGPAGGVPFLARYNPDGTPDSSFGHAGSGVLNLGFAPFAGGGNGIHDVAIQPGTNRVLLGGGGAGLSVFAVEGIAADVTPPAVALSDLVAIRRDDQDPTFTAVFSDAAGVNGATIDGDEFRVSGPGVSYIASLVSVTPPDAGGGAWTAVYRYAPPGGLTAAGNGAYSVSVEPGSVRDASGLPIAGAPGVGSFDVALPTDGPNLVVHRATVNRRSFYLGDARRGRVVFVLKNTGTRPVNGTVDVAINATLRPGTAGGTTVVVQPFAPIRVSLRRGASRRYSVPMGTFSADAPAGTYDLSLRVDATDTVGETSEKDNIFSVSVTVKARPVRPARGRRA